MGSLKRKSLWNSSAREIPWRIEEDSKVKKPSQKETRPEESRGDLKTYND
jgi:hypothetical protein